MVDNIAQTIASDMPPLTFGNLQPRLACQRSGKPEHIRDGSEYGKWILFDYDELTSVWFMLKRNLLCGKMRALKMVCPSKRKLYSQSQVDRRPQFHVHTTEEQMKEVGGILISVVRRCSLAVGMSCSTTTSHTMKSKHYRC